MDASEAGARIDAGSDMQEDQAEYDKARGRWLEERVDRVIRFTAQQVEDDPAGAVYPTRSLPRPLDQAQEEAGRGARDAPGTPTGPCTRRGSSRRTNRRRGGIHDR
jgi:hypothetical protein